MHLSLPERPIWPVAKENMLPSNRCYAGGNLGGCTPEYDQYRVNYHCAKFHAFIHFWSTLIFCFTTYHTRC